MPETTLAGPEAKLKELGLTLPSLPKPVAAYVHAVKTGNLVFVAGQIPTRDGKPVFTGRVGKELTLEQGKEAARIAALNVLAALKEAAGGFERVVRIVRTNNYVAAAPGFTDVHLVANGASELFQQVLGERGRHSRVTIGAAELPLNVPFEVDVVAEVK
jgi:enamine deaminase RidA (YjgF/YER057c/UK114 family)